MQVRPLLSVPEKLAFAIDSAGTKSGVDFDYLLQTAIRESSLDPKAKAASSSATGLFQFIDSTWLEVMKEQGPRLGYKAYADAITVDRSGDYEVADPAMRAEILKLREDPQVASDLAAAFTRANGAYLSQKFGRMPSPGELYIAHFMGARGAEAFFRAGLENPDQNAAQLFPKQARANPTIFYDNGKGRSVRDVYRALVHRHEALSAPANANFAAQQLATDPPGKWPEAEAVPSRFSPADMSFTSLFASEPAARGPVTQQIEGRVLMSPDSEAQGPALFTGLYGGKGEPGS